MVIIRSPAFKVVIGLTYLSGIEKFPCGKFIQKFVFPNIYVEIANSSNILDFIALCTNITAEKRLKKILTNHKMFCEESGVVFCFNV